MAIIFWLNFPDTKVKTLCQEAKKRISQKPRCNKLIISKLQECRKFKISHPFIYHVENP